MEMRTFGIKFSSIAVHHSAREGKQKTVIAQGEVFEKYYPRPAASKTNLSFG